MRRTWTAALLMLVVVGFALPAFAVEVAPRILDREIVEALAELKTGQKSLQQQIDDLKQSTQQQFSDLRQDMNQRFQDMNQRFNDVMTLLQILIGVLALVLGGLLAWLVGNLRKAVEIGGRPQAFEVQKDQIEFLRERYKCMQGALLHLLERSSALW